MFTRTRAAGLGMRGLGKMGNAVRVVALLGACGGAASAIAQTYSGPAGGSWTVAGNWTPSGVPTTNSDVVLSQPGTSVLLPNATTSINGLSVLNNATIGFVVPAFNASVLQVRNGGVVLGGTLTVGDGSPNGGTLQVSQPPGITASASTGTGRILLATPASGATTSNGVTGAASTGPATPIGPGVTIEGRGFLAGSFTNRGTIGPWVTITGTVVNQPGSSISVGDDPEGNARTITLGQGSPASSARLIGGVLQSSGNSSFLATGSGTWPTVLNSVRLAGTLGVLENGRVRTEGGGLTVEQGSRLVINTAGSTADAIFEVAAPLDGPGEIVLNAPESDITGAQIVPGAGGGVLGAAARVTGRGSMGGIGGLVNRGVIGPGPTISGLVIQEGEGRVSAGVGQVFLTPPGRVNGGRLDSLPGGSISVGLSTFSSSVATIDGVTLDGRMLLTSQARLRVETGGLTLVNGSVVELTTGTTSGGGTSGSIMELADASTVTGQGLLLFSPGVGVPSTASMTIAAVANGVALIGDGIEVRGPGTLSGTFINRGLLAAGVSISGTMVQENQGRIAPVNGQVTISGGRVAGGLIAPGAGGSVRTIFATNTPSLSGVRVRDVLRITENSRLRIDSPGVTLEDNATLLVNPIASLSDGILELTAGAALTGSGTVNLNANVSDNTSAQMVTSAGATGIIGPGVTVRGPGLVSGTFTNQGVIGPGPTVAGTITQATGGVIQAGGEPLLIAANARVVGGRLGSSGPGTIQTAGSTSTTPAVVTLVDTIAAGAIHVREGGRLRIEGTGLTGEPGASIVVNPASGARTTTIDLDNNATITGDLSIVLAGTLEQPLGTAVVVGTTRSAALGPGVRVTGRGALDGRLTVLGTIAPGIAGAEGQITYRSGITLGPAARTEIDLSGQILAQRDRLVAAADAPLGASIALDGVLSVRPIAPYRPRPCEVVDVIVGPYTRQFPVVEQPTTAPGSFQVLYQADGVRVRYLPFDMNGSGGNDADDVFLFLNEWFGQTARADVNGIFGATIDDVFVFLEYWFAGCR